MRLANARNGLVYPHDDVCFSQSTHAHHFRDGYYRMDAMPWRAIIHLLQGGTLTIVDGSQHNRMSDALRKGVPTWCLTFNRAIRDPVQVCKWETKYMRRAAYSPMHAKEVGCIRKLARLYGHKHPAIIGETVFLECHQLIEHDDKPELMEVYRGLSLSR